MKSTRPETLAERSRCITAVAPLFTSASVPAVVKALLTLEFAPARDAYTAAVTGAKTARSAVVDAQKGVDAADGVFDSSFRLWASSVRDPGGKAMPVEVAKLFGGTRAGDLVRLPPRQELAHTSDLEAQIAENPAVAGDAADLAALVAARDVLEVAVGVLEGAESTRTRTSEVLVATATAFDKAWGTLAKKLLADPDLAVLVPKFRRTDPDPADAAGTDAPATEAEPEPDADAEEPEADPDPEEPPAEA